MFRRRHKSVAFPAVLLLFALMLGGCGYHIAGLGGKFPGGVTTLSIPVFKNTTAKPDIEATISSAFVTEFVNTVEIFEIGAQAVMNGSIKSYTLTPISFAKNDITQEYRLTVVMDIKIVRTSDSAVVWEDSNVSDYEDFNVNIGDVNITRDRETAALKKLSKDTARLVKERILEGF